uniref:Uncharacterized protein n=1 Tax=viral metagenome TaxID=1070528 RepID=A0A6C0H4T0_9ZZZZ
MDSQEVITLEYLRTFVDVGKFIKKNYKYYKYDNYILLDIDINLGKRIIGKYNLHISIINKENRNIKDNLVNE